MCKERLLNLLMYRRAYIRARVWANSKAQAVISHCVWLGQLEPTTHPPHTHDIKCANNQAQKLKSIRLNQRVKSSSEKAATSRFGRSGVEAGLWIWAHAHDLCGKLRKEGSGSVTGGRLDWHRCEVPHCSTGDHWQQTARVSLGFKSSSFSHSDQRPFKASSSLSSYAPLAAAEGAVAQEAAAGPPSSQRMVD